VRARQRDVHIFEDLAKGLRTVQVKKSACECAHLCPLALKLDQPSS